MATRTTRNRQITEQSNGAHKDEAFDAPAHETENARFAQVGEFRQANVAISQAGVALKVGGVDADSGSKYIAGRAGTIIGVAWALTAAATHTAGSIKAAVGPAGGTLAAVGDQVQIDGGGTSGVVDQSSAAPVVGNPSAPVGIPFAEGDALGVLITTDAAWLPVTTDLTVWLLIRWAA